MRKEGLFFGCLCVVASGCVSTIGTESDGALLPIFVHELAVSPGCYVNPPAPVTEDGPSDMMAAAREMQEMNATYNMQFAALIIRKMLEEPTAPAWSFGWGEASQLGGTVDVRVDVDNREVAESDFVVEMTHRFGSIDTGGPTSFVELTTVAYGHADRHGSRLDLPYAVLRWTDHAWDMQLQSGTVDGSASGVSGSIGSGGSSASSSSGMSSASGSSGSADSSASPNASGLSGSVSAGSLTTLTMLRGCDPETGISFEAMPSQPLACWNPAPALMSCNSVNFWPI